jgi:hypothetical protein
VQNLFVTFAIYARFLYLQRSIVSIFLSILKAFSRFAGHTSAGCSRPLFPMRRIAAAVETGDDGKRFVSLDDEQ